MSERRSRRRKRESESEDEENEVGDEQTEIAKHLRFNCETKSSNYQGQKVEYFKGSKAIDCLLDSKWASGKGGTEILFTDRESVQDYLGTLLDLGMFKRVTRVRKKKKGEKDEAKKGTKDSKDSPKPGKSKKDSNDGKNGETDGKKIKVKVKLEIHEYQEFLDGEEVYMWIFDPVHPRTIIYGVLVVIGAIIICLFPLWPAQMREYTWYVSVAAAILLGALIVVALFRYVLFGFIWAVTIGKYHFWLLPNLTEDCGFFESFVPLYSYSYFGPEKEDKTGKPDENDDKIEKLGDQQEQGNEEKEAMDEKGEENRNSDGNSGGQEDRNSSKKVREPNEAEPWIKVTDEDVAQAKEATGNKSDSKTMASPINC